MRTTGDILTFSVSAWAILPIAAVHIPLLGGLAVVLLRQKERIRDAVTLGTALLTMIAVSLMYKPAIQGIQIGEQIYTGLEFSVPILLQPGVGFKVDAVSFIFAAITVIVWTVALIFSLPYMKNERAQTSYYFFSLLALAANLGVVLTRDFLSLYIFFEALAFFSYMLFIHRRDQQSLAAGRLYLYLSIAGGLCLLMGFLMIFYYAGSVNIEPMGRLVSEAIPASVKYLIVGLLISGFGVKAGIFFLHSWMPEAYPPAPGPVCAISSGAMIKAGVYGILRTVNVLFAPAIVLTANESTLSSIGYAVIWIGLITMFGGMVNALVSKECKRLLAYSSISQMGYIVLGLGVAAYLGREGAMAMAGSVYHIVNHAFFKSALFLVIGVVYFRTRQQDLNKLGGLWKDMPFTAVICLVAVLSLSGIPGFGGFASKTILHEAVLEALSNSPAVPLLPNPKVLLQIAEVLFVVTAAGTICYSVRLFASVFLFERSSYIEKAAPETTSMKIALFPLAVLILWFGLKPNLLLERFIGPALALFGFDPATHSYQALYNAGAISGALRSTIPILYDPKTLSIVGNPEVIHNLQIAGIEIIGGAALLVVGYRFGLFGLEAPEWMATKYWYLKGADGFLGLIGMTSVIRKRVSDFSITSVASQTISQQKEWFSKQLQIEENLEKERTEVVKSALRALNLHMRRTGIAPELRRARIEEVRAIVGKEQADLMQLKKSIMKETILALQLSETPFDERSQELIEVMGPIVDVAQLSKKGLQMLYGAIKRYNEKVVGNESKKSGLIPAIIRDEKLGREMTSSAGIKEKWDLLMERYRVAEANRLRQKERLVERITRWAGNMLRILTEIFAPEKLPWIAEERLSLSQLDQTKTSIRNYTRDINLNVLIILGLFIAMVLILFLGIYLNT